MIARYVYRAQIRENALDAAQNLLDRTAMPEDIVTISVFRFEKNLFFYYELSGGDRHPEDLFPGLNAFLEACPFEEEKRYYIRMYDIFHYNRPTADKPWRGRPMGEPVGRLIRLRPEKVGSYIFYHQQLQEEYPGDGCKYGLIAIHENLLFFYLETPEYSEEATWKGFLDTKNSPRSQWHELMHEHFQFWNDERFPYWRNDLTLIYSKRCESIGTI